MPRKRMDRREAPPTGIFDAGYVGGRERGERVLGQDHDVVLDRNAVANARLGRRLPLKLAQHRVEIVPERVGLDFVNQLHSSRLSPTTGFQTLISPALPGAHGSFDEAVDRGVFGQELAQDCSEKKGAACLQMRSHPPRWSPECRGPHCSPCPGGILRTTGSVDTFTIPPDPPLDIRVGCIGENHQHLAQGCRPVPAGSSRQSQVVELQKIDELPQDRPGWVPRRVP